jgi:hypothetical protein
MGHEFFPEGQTNAQNDKLSPRFAELARQEREIRQRADALKREKEELEKVKAKYKQYNEMESLKVENPLQWLEKNGVSYDKLTESLANSEDHKDGIVVKEMRDQMRQMMEMVNSLKTDLSAQKEEQVNRMKQAEETNNEYQKRAWLSSLKKKAELDPDKFEMVNTFWDDGLAFEIQTQYYNKTGQLLEEDVLLENLETHLDKINKEHYNKLNTLKKFRREDELEPSSFEKNDETELPEWMRRKKTLSKEMPVASSSTPTSNQPYLSRDESIDAIASKYNLFKQE